MKKKIFIQPATGTYEYWSHSIPKKSFSLFSEKFTKNSSFFQSWDSNFLKNLFFVSGLDIEILFKWEGRVHNEGRSSFGSHANLISTNIWLCLNEFCKAGV